MQLSSAAIPQTPPDAPPIPEPPMMLPFPNAAPETPGIVAPTTPGIFDDPSLNRTSSDTWVKQSKAKVHSSHSEPKAVLRKWDSVGALVLLDVDALLASGELRIEELCGLFPIYKDHLYDRLILNPTVRNGRTDSLHCFVRTLGQGFMFCRMHLPPPNPVHEH